MIISLRLKNFFSIRDEAVLDFTAEQSSRKANLLPENLLGYSSDKFINIIGLFGSNAAGKSNIIKAVDFCRNLVLHSHLNNAGDTFDFTPFKFQEDKPSEFTIDFVSEGVEYEYSFTLADGKVVAESLYHFANRRKARVFERTDTEKYTYGKGMIQRGKEVEVNTGPQTLFLSRASSMNRPIPQAVYRFFRHNMSIGLKNTDVENVSKEEFERFLPILLKAFEVSDSDIIDIQFVDNGNGQRRLLTYHRENPAIPFDFEKEESEGTKRLFYIMLMLLRKSLDKAAIFLDEFDLKLHLRLAEFVLDTVRASRGAQLIFTSHSSPLIDTGRLRREQIVFVTKQPDGNSEFVPLSDYEGVGSNIDIQKAYLQGRFDAVPYIGNIYNVLDEMIAVEP